MGTDAVELSCKEAAKLLSHQRDRALSATEAEVLKAHLYHCLSCRNFGDQLGFLSRLARRYGNEGPPPEDAPV